MNYKSFAFIVDEDIFHYLRVPEISDLEGVLAGMRSNPKVVEVPPGMPEQMGADWKYVNGQFVAPPNWTPPQDYEVED